MAMVLALSPRPARPIHPPKTAMLAVAPESTSLAEPPESTMLAVPPESALLPVAATVTPPEADPHQWQHAVLQS